MLPFYFRISRNTLMSIVITHKTTRFFETSTELDHAQLHRLKEISSNALSPLKIVIFGKYNHGKSTFLNAWLKQNLFKTGDTRVTTQIQSYADIQNDIIWVDTPGLDADKEDDKKAIATIKEADLVLLIHDSVAGELDKKELDFIQQYSNSTGKGKIRLLLTKIDQNEDNVAQIIELIESQVAYLNIKIFPISPARYLKYISESLDIWKEKSGFDALVPDIEKASKKRNSIRKEEIQLLCEKLAQQLYHQKNNLSRDLNQLNKRKKSITKDFEQATKHLLNTI